MSASRLRRSGAQAAGCRARWRGCAGRRFGGGDDFGRLEGQHVLGVVHLPEGVAQFMQGAGAEGGDPQLAAGAQAAGEFGEGAARAHHCSA
jgi:hypothetical protein